MREKNAIAGPGASGKSEGPIIEVRNLKREQIVRLLAADAMWASEAALKNQQPEAQTIARLLVGNLKRKQ